MISPVAASNRETSIDRLNTANVPYRDPVSAVPWDHLDSEHPWLPERLVSLYGLPEYGTLTQAQRLRLTQLEFVATARLGLWLEALFLIRFSRTTLRQLKSDPAAYQHQLHELREEAGHSLMFIELMRRSGVPVDLSIEHRPRLASLFARLAPAHSPLFWATVFVGEAVPNELNRLIHADASLPAAVQAIVQAHMNDEVRHIAYARLKLTHELPRANGVTRRLLSPLLRIVTKQFVDTCFYPPPKLYADAGISNPLRVALAVRHSEPRAALVRECLEPARRFLCEHGFRL